MKIFSGLGYNVYTLFVAPSLYMLFSLISYHQVNGEDVQGLSHARVIGMLRKITGTVELEIKRYALVKGFSNIIKNDSHQ